jgi:hypothetical protein
LNSSEAKLDILASTMKEMMQKFIMGNQLVFQVHHVPLVTNKERVTISKHFACYPWYHQLENYYFMYSIHNTVKYETQAQLVEEKSFDMMYMFDEIYFRDDLTKYYKYDENYTKVNSSKP